MHSGIETISSSQPAAPYRFLYVFVRFSQFQPHFLCPAPAFLAGAYFKPSPYFIMFYRKLNFLSTILKRLKFLKKYAIINWINMNNFECGVLKCLKQ